MLIDGWLYSRKRKQRWWRFLQLQEVYQSAQSAAEPEKLLERCFRKLGYPTPEQELVFIWRQWIALGAARKPVLSADDITSLESSVQALSCHSMPFLAWLDLCRLAIGVGLYGLAQRFRQQAILCGASIADDAGAKVPTTAELACGMYCCLELQDYVRAEELIVRLEHSDLSREKLRQARWLFDLLSGKRPSQAIGDRSGADELDQAFGDYVFGRELALVGPVPVTVAQGPEIDGFDRVVKFSYQGGDKGRDSETQGKRIDVSYYNNTQAERLADGPYAEVLAQMDWGVCINRKGRSRFPSGERKLRQLESLQWLLPDTHLNAGPNAMLDLLRFNPSYIKVFNTDLMLSAGRYAGYRAPGAKPIQYTRSFIKTHDPILQYKVINRLWELGYIRGDDRFEDVMEMGLDGYLKSLQRVHGADEQALL
jgi:hypothetical protein